MKKVIIYQENVEPIVLFDQDEASLEDYSERLSSVFQGVNISLLKVTSGTVVLRPHKLVCVLVSEESEESKVEEESLDIVSDGEE